MNTLDKIASAHYVANDAQIEALAREQYISTAQVSVANATYLRVLVAGCQAELGGRRGRAPVRPDAQSAVLERVHERFYAAVLRGVTTEDVVADDSLDRAEKGRRMLERNRRSGFARSAATTLRNYVQAGGDLRALDVETTTKTALQQFVASKAAPDVDRIGARVARAERTLLAALKRMAKEDPDRAAEAMEAITEHLQVALSELEPSPQVVAGTQAEAAPTPRHARTRVGVPFMRLPQGRSP
ncbi:MAG TPA: hypothetical protein VN734_17265 [Acidobacteriaceae bacterium]|nr:hypothetical protein [Acidobacteriaceae bacterium]